jgi:outer membrane immunogenic protein
MKKLLLGGVTLLALSAVPPVTAADISATVVPSTPVYTSTAFDWTGLYVGVTAGLGSGADTSVSFGGASFPVTSHGGLLGGIGVGYNFQLGGSGVIGIEADISASDLGTDSNFLGSNFTNRVTSFGTVRARAGYTFDRFMPYVTAGVAWGNSNVTYGAFSGSATSAGWVAGLGLEFAFADNWTAKAEYLRLNLGDTTYNTGVSNLVIGNSANIVRLGLNYKF